MLALLVDGRPYPDVVRATVTAAADDAVRRAVLECTEAPGALARQAAATVLLDGEPVVTGFIEKIARRVEKGRVRATVTVASKAAKGVKTAAAAPGHRLAGATAGTAARVLLAPVGVTVTDELGGKASDWAWSPGTGAHAVIEERLRASRALIMGGADGGIILAKGPRGRHAGPLTLPGRILEASSDERTDGEYDETEVIGQKRDGETAAALRPRAVARGTVRDGTRQILLAETEFDGEDLTLRAAQRRDRRKASDVSATLAVDGWTDAAGALWSPSFIVHIRVPELALDREMAIKSVSWTWERAGGRAELNLVEPSSLGDGETDPARYGEDS